MYVEHCCSPDQRKAVRVGSDAWVLRSQCSALAAGVHKIDEKHYLRVPLLLYSSRTAFFYFFQVWEDTVGRRRQALAP